MKFIKFIIFIVTVIVLGVGGTILYWFNDMKQNQGMRTSDTAEIALCKEFENVDSKISCTEAAAIALYHHPGTISKVAIGSKVAPDLSTGILKRTDSWLFDVKRNSAYFFESAGQETRFLQVGVGLDGNTPVSIKPLDL